MKALIILALLAVITMLMGLFKTRKLIVPVVVLGLVGILAMISQYGCTCSDKLYGLFIDEHQFNKMFDINKNSGFAGLIVICGILISLMASKGLNYIENHRADMYALMLFSLCGAIISISYMNLLMLFLGIEIMSIPLYVMAGSNKSDAHSNESGLKYFLLGSFATGILLFGIAMIYGATGTFNINQINNFAHNQLNLSAGIFKIGVLFTMVGLLFKVGAAPFHFWAPDVYSGAPNIITSFMSTIVKVAGFGAVVLFFNGILKPLDNQWGITLALVSGLTMLLGNISALVQISFKRMLAWSSVAHAGYLLMGVASNSINTPKATLLYLFAYCLASIICFCIIILTGYEKFDSFNGLGKRNKWIGISLSIALLSLAGIPPLAGFMGKYYLFTNVYETYPALVIIAIISSAISIAYYLKAIIATWFKSPTSDDKLEVDLISLFVLLACVLGLIAIGILPIEILNLA